MTPDYQQSRNLTAIRDRHPFPWIEQRAPTGAVRLLDANLKEVFLFEMTALCLLITKAVSQGIPIEMMMAQNDQKAKEANAAHPATN